MFSLQSLIRLPKSAVTTPLLRRYLHLHEYQSMQLLQSHGLPVPQAIISENVNDAIQSYRQIIGNNKHKDVVLKAQILSGGRGLGKFKHSGLQGGVHMCRSEEDVKHYASKMLGDYLVTKQTGNDGVKVNKIFLAERLYLRREMYLSIIMDRQSQGPMFLASASGGTSIETLAKESPELLIYQPIHPINGPTKEQLEAIAKKLNLPKELYSQCTDILEKLYKIFCKYDATQVEINPFCESSEGNLIICDIKMNFDDNASFRQKELFAMRDTSQEDSRDVEASAANLNYIALSGSIGCLVNGAGLAMATMDGIKLSGGSPANFLDVGGSATEKQVETAFKILNKDPHVKAILVNIFGGIMRCDVIAQGIVSAAKNLKLEKPIIVRLEGTKVDEANEIFKKSALDLIIARSLCEASEKAVVAAKIGSLATENNMKVKIFSDMK